MKTVAVIPTRYEPERLRRLVEIVAPEVDRCLVMDNGHARPELLEGLNAEQHDCQGWNIYRMWNHGWELARVGETAADPVNVAILNDDIRLPPGALRLLARALRAEPKIGAVCPDPSAAPWRDGQTPPIAIRYSFGTLEPVGPRDLYGPCFMFKAELPIPPFDEGYAWWYADTQFDEAIKLAGFVVARVGGVPVEHLVTDQNAAFTRRPELRAMSERDGERWARLHKRVVGGRWVPE